MEVEAVGVAAAEERGQMKLDLVSHRLLRKRQAPVLLREQAPTL